MYSSDLDRDVTLVEHWDGEGWTTVPSPDPGDSLSSALLGVSGTSAPDARAVGWYDNGARHRPLIEHWDGFEWAES